jgi:preprotein translocase subunit SecA
MVRFGGQQMEGLLTRLRVDDAMPIEHNLVSRIVESSQTRVEGANFDVRKHLLEYDDVLNTQRAKIYGQRDRIFAKDDLSEDVNEMLRVEVLRRVPEALADEGGPWKLLSWLEQIQPSLTLHDSSFPSYTLKLLLDSTHPAAPAASRSLQFDRPSARKALLELAAASIRAEQEHVLSSVETLLEQSQDRLDEQLEERLDALEAFFEGLSDAEEAEQRSPQQLAEALSAAVRLPLRLSNAQIRSLSEDPEAVAPTVRDLVEKLMMGLSITRVIGAVERVLKEPLGIQEIQLREADWRGLSNQVLAAVEATFHRRLERFIGNGSPGQIANDIDFSLTKIEGEFISGDDFLRLILSLPYGRRAAFDKKTHRRVWERTTRLTYIYHAARLLEDRPPEEITAESLDHLEGAEVAIRRMWGESELRRLGAVRCIDLEQNSRTGLQRALGEQVFGSIEGQPFNTLAGELRQQVSDELGRQALTSIYRQLLLRVISELWVEYLTQMEALRVAIGLEAYAQRDPLVQYKNRAFEMFQQLLSDMRMNVATRMFTFRPRDLSTVQPGVSRAEEADQPPESAEHAEAPPESEEKKKSRRRRGRR